MAQGAGQGTAAKLIAYMIVSNRVYTKAYILSQASPVR